MLQTILDYFTQLSQIPRESGNEEGVRRWLITRSTSHGYSYEVDTIGNLIVRVPATSGFENFQTTILQAHMDMVCVAHPSVDHDFSKNSIQWKIADGRMKAQGTTLGADNGIGLCMILTACAQEHGPLELYFTVDEEVGLTGALHTQPELFTGTLLINLDTEDLGEITISSAGGARMDITLPVARIPAILPQYTLLLDGLIGGHSGAEIHHPRGNAHRIVQELLLAYPDSIELVSVSGGSADNAIPASSSAVVGIQDVDNFQTFAQELLERYRQELDHTSLNITLTKTDTQLPSIAYRKEFIHRLATLPLGIQSISEKIPGLTQTSLSRGILKTNDESIQYSGALRSSVMQELDDLIRSCQDHIGNLGSATLRGKYPGRQQDPTSDIVTITHQIYEEILGDEVELKAVHAGLECGAIAGAFDRPIDAVSFGPTILDPHSPDERCDIHSIEITYEVLKRLLQELE